MSDFKIRKAKSSDCFDLSLLKREIWETTYRGIYPDSKIDNYNYQENEKTIDTRECTKALSYVKKSINEKDEQMNTPRSKLRGIFPKRCYFCC